MALDTYTNLVASIAAWAKRDDLTSVIPDLIVLAEERMNRDLRVTEMEVDGTLTCSTSVRTIALPTGFLSVRRAYLNVSPIINLSGKSADQIESNYEQTAGKPKYYAVIAGNLQFERIPDSAYTIYINYYKKPTALSASNATNSVLTYYPSVYLYGCLVQTATYSFDDARVPLWERMYRDAVDMANNQAMHTRFGNALQVQAV